MCNIAENSVGLGNRTLEKLKVNKQRLLNGGVNCVPTPFKRFVDDFCGIEQATYYLVTSWTKGAKSQLTSYIFIFRLVIYAYFAKNFAFKIIYFPLEETKDRIMQRFMSWLLFRVSKRQMRVSPKELRSTVTPVDQKILDRLEQFDIQNIIEFFEEHVIFPNESPNPTGIYKYCQQYAETHGTVHKKTVKMKDEFGVSKDVEVFDYYEQDNPDEYRLIIIDTINLIDTERGMNLKQSIDKLSEYCAKYLRNRYHYSPVIVQQQSTESESNDAVKLGRARPSTYGLGDSRYTSHDANVVFGLYSPFRFGIPECEGYDITVLRDHFRVLEVLVNRDGEMGGKIGLWFDGAVCDFQELPKPDDKPALQSWYNMCKNLAITKNYPSLATPSTSSTLFLSINNTIKHFFNFNKFNYQKCARF